MIIESYEPPRWSEHSPDMTQPADRFWEGLGMILLVLLGAVFTAVILILWFLCII